MIEKTLSEGTSLVTLGSASNTRISCQPQIRTLTEEPSRMLWVVQKVSNNLDKIGIQLTLNFAISIVVAVGDIEILPFSLFSWPKTFSNKIRFSKIHALTFQTNRFNILDGWSSDEGSCDLCIRDIHLRDFSFCSYVLTYILRVSHCPSRYSLELSLFENHSSLHGNMSVSIDIEWLPTWWKTFLHVCSV